MLYEKYAKKGSILCEDTWAKLMHKMEAWYAPAGVTLIHEGCKEDRISYCIEGLIKCSYIHNDKDEIYDFKQAPCAISDVFSICNNDKAAISVTTLTETTFVSIPSDHYLKIIGEDPNIGELGYKSLTNKLALQKFRNSSKKQIAVEERYKIATALYSEIITHINTKDLASYLDITTEEVKNIQIEHSKKEGKQLL